jgi:hypothetical protein
MGSVGFDYSVFFFVQIREIIRDGSRLDEELWET